MNDYPMYRELMLARAFAVVPMPDNLSWVGAAAAWMQNMTGYGALIQFGGLTAGDTARITCGVFERRSGGDPDRERRSERGRSR